MLSTGKILLIPIRVTSAGFRLARRAAAAIRSCTWRIFAAIDIKACTTKDTKYHDGEAVGFSSCDGVKGMGRASPWTFQPRSGQARGTPVPTRSLLTSCLRAVLAHWDRQRW